MSPPFQPGRPGEPNAPASPPARLFCIHSYAGDAGPRCGWHGPAHEAYRDEPSGVRRCPRCGRATLLELPPAEK